MILLLSFKKYKDTSSETAVGASSSSSIATNFEVYDGEIIISRFFDSKLYSITTRCQTIGELGNLVKNYTKLDNKSFKVASYKDKFKLLVFRQVGA